MFTRELQDRVDYLFGNGNIPPFPKGGTSGVYIGKLVELLITMTGNQQKLFWTLVAATNEWNQVHKSRKEIGEIYMKNYQSSNMTKDISKLTELEMIAMVGSVIMINPFLIVPYVKNPKLKSVIQTAWEELVYYE